MSNIVSICVSCGCDSNTMLCEACARRRIELSHQPPAGAYTQEWERMKRDYRFHNRKLSIAEIEAEERELW